jgi:hypothetical protein
MERTLNLGKGAPFVKSRGRCLLNTLGTVFERGKCRSGFLCPPCIQQKSHKSQTHASGLEALAHLVGKLVVLVVDCEHGSVPFGIERRIGYVALTVERMPHP